MRENNPLNKVKNMTKLEFCEKHNESYTPETLQTTDVLMRIASNLSDLHTEQHLFTPEQMDEKLNNLKKYIFDFDSVLRMEQLSQLKELT